jgi:Protein of unknown function (DUF1810)
VFDVGEDNKLTNDTVFHDLKDMAGGIADDIRVDEAGNLWSAGGWAEHDQNFNGVSVYAPDGTPIGGLGTSPMVNKYAIPSRAEAEAYLDHPVLGPRLRECVRLVTAIEGRTIEQIFAYPDDLKFRTSMTLFAAAASDSKLFTDAIEKYFPTGFGPLTLERL